MGVSIEGIGQKSASVGDSSAVALVGYGQSEAIGIPEDWDVKAISEIAAVRTGPFGSALHERDYVDNGTPIITVEHLSERGVVHEGLPMVSDADRARLAKYELRTGDIVFSRVGSIDRNSLIGKEEDGWLFSGRLLRVRTLDDTTYPPYLSYHFHSEPFKRRVRSVAVGQTMASLNTQILNDLCVSLPGVQEQRAIAEALSDVDDLLAALEALIAKKRAIKQAAMQQLLTGETRLPGFSGEWSGLNMARDSAVKARIGWQGLTTAEYLTTGNYYLVTGTDFSEGSVAWSSCFFVDHNRYTQDTNIQLAPNDVLLTKDGTIGKAGFVETLPGPATLNSGVFVIRPRAGSYVPRYMYYVLTSAIFDDFLARLQAGSTISHLYQKDFVTFDFAAPEMGEQHAIAAVLSDMDMEITALERRLDKTRAIKQGMMQELLTGRIRLVKAGG